MSTGDVHSSPVDLTRAPPEISIQIKAILFTYIYISVCGRQRKIVRVDDSRFVHIKIYPH